MRPKLLFNHNKCYFFNNFKTFNVKLHKFFVANFSCSTNDIFFFFKYKLLFDGILKANLIFLINISLRNTSIEGKKELKT